jgi:hypothetical protein
MLFCALCRQKFGTMPFPEIHLTGGALTPLNVTAFVTIVDSDAFNNFALQLMQSSLVTLNLFSKVNVKAAGLRYNSIDFNKDMTIRGVTACAILCCRVC